MKIKVLKRFKDKHNGSIYNAGTVLEVSEERFEEINKTNASLVEAVEEKTEEGKAEETATEETATEETEEKKPTKKAKTK